MVGLRSIVDGRPVAVDERRAARGAVRATSGWFALFSKHGPHPDPAYRPG